MNAFSFPAGRRRGSAHHSGECERYVSCDTAPPDYRAHRRGFMLILAVAGVAAAVAIVAGAMQGVSDMGAAFPHASALFEAASWDRFFAAFGRVAALVLVLACVVTILRRRRKRRAPVPAKK